MQQPLPLEKRKRAANFSDKEKFRFVRLLQEKGHVIINKTTCHDNRTNKLKEEVWNRICRDHNSSGSVMRNTDTLKKLWQKLKSDAKVYNAAARQQVHGTGGGPCVKSNNPGLELVVEMTGRRSSGISGVLDCDSDLIPVSQHDVFEAGPPSPKPPTANPQDLLFETSIVMEKDNAVADNAEVENAEVPSYTEEITVVSADAVPLTTIPRLKRRRPNLPLHSDRSEPLRAKCYSYSLAAERLRSERDKGELIKLKIRQEMEVHNLKMEVHNLKMENERKIHLLKVQILEKIARKIEDAAQVDTDTIKVAFSQLGEGSGE